jgi:hypothetical protein
VELRLKCSVCQFVTIRENCAKVEQVKLVSRELKFETDAVECCDLCWGIGGHDCLAEASAGDETAMCCDCCAIPPTFESIRCNGDDLKQVIKILVAGGTYTTFSGMMTGMGKVMSESQFYRIQQALCPNLEEFLQTQLETIRTEYCNFLEAQSSEKEVSEICLSVDCAWCHKGYKSKMGTLMVRSFTHNIPLSVVPLQKPHIVRTRRSEYRYDDNADAFPSNYSGTSGGMEVFGAGVAGKELEKSGLGKFSSLAVGDGDAGAVEMIQATPTFEKMLRAGDPGHAGKNFMRSLRKACGEARKGFAYRIPKFAMRLVKRSEKLFAGQDSATVAVREAWFQTQWRFAFSHYTQKECPSTCPCNQFYGDDAAPDLREGDLSRSFSDVFHREDSRAKNKAVRRDIDAVGAEDLFRANLLEELIDCEQNGVDLSDELECEGIRDDVKSKTFHIVSEIKMGEEVPVGKDDKFVKMRRVEKVWLDLSVKKDAALWAKIAPLMERYANGVHEILWAVNTCASENSNRRRLVFLPKDRFFPRSFAVRSLISAVLEVQPKAELYERVLNHFSLKITDCDIVAMQMYHMMQEKKEWHAARKVSIGFALRAKVVAERKILYNQENLAATHARREETNQTQTYTKLVNKIMPNIPLTGFAAYKSRARSQATIAEEYRKGFEGVSFCESCNLYSRDNVMKPHKCKKKSGSGGGGKSQPKLYEKWKADSDSVKECSICGLYYLKTHKKCATSRSKAKLSAADKRQIDERQERDAGGTQPQEESSPALPARKGKRIKISKKIEEIEDDEEEELELKNEEDEEEDEEEEFDVDSDSSASYTPWVTLFRKLRQKKRQEDPTKIRRKVFPLCNRLPKSAKQKLRNGKPIRLHEWTIQMPEARRCTMKQISLL